jgi:hypothetical protein
MKIYSIEVMSSDITFVPNFVKIGQLVQNLKWRHTGASPHTDARTLTHTHSKHGDLISLIFSF